ncbi:MAG: hypothetical protein ACREVK_03110 [Gammaproteobacteria bacterium]
MLPRKIDVAKTPGQLGATHHRAFFAGEANSEKSFGQWGPCVFLVAGKMAAEIGIAYQTFWAWETGKVPIPVTLEADPAPAEVQGAPQRLKLTVMVRLCSYSRHKAEFIKKPAEWPSIA